MIDVASIPSNQKTAESLTDGLTASWLADAWCNPPHSKTKQFVLKADAEWLKNNINVLMIIPANALTTNYFFKVINHVEYYPIKNRITFLVDGVPAKDHSRNGYFVIVWRKR